MSDKPADQKSCPITVVIATLGGETLSTTIETLNRGTLVPQEVLVCIPRDEASRVERLSFDNLRVLVTDCRGQVAQRASGFRSASQEVVMQLDDDMLVDERCVEHLLHALRLAGPKAAVAPALVDAETGQSVYRKAERNWLLEALYYWMMNGSAGYQEGQIQRSGSPVGIDPSREGKDTYDVEWLAGGCVMHYRDNLVLENFYPFSGKAYGEDVIHSHYLKARGVRLLIAARAVCRLDNISVASSTPRQFFRDLLGDFRARRHFMLISTRPSLRMYLFYVAMCMTYLVKKLSGSRTRASDS